MHSGKTAQQLVDEGFAAHQSGDLGKASSYFRAALEQAPDHPEALHFLGLACEQEGDRQQAIKLISRAVEVDPGEPAFRLNFAALMESEGRFAEAVKHLRVAAAKAPSDATIGVRLARALFQAGAYADACNVAMKAAHFAPSSNVMALTIAAAAAHQSRNWQALIKAAEEWRRAAPSDLQSLRFLAGAWFELGDMEKARDAFKAIADRPNASTDDLTAYGRYCISAFDYEAARGVLEKARNMAPESALAAFALSRLNFFEGKLEEAEDLCLKSISTDPSLAPAYSHLARVKNGAIPEAFLEPMRRLAENGDVAGEHRASLYFAIGEAHHHNGEYQDATSAFSNGNGITEELFAMEGCAYDAVETGAARRRELSLFTGAGAASFEKSPAMPIFIVGMPRSGTTLIESVLAAHPEVFGAGEMISMPGISNEAQQWMARSGVRSLDDVPEQILQGWRKRYIESWPDIGEARFITDKQPVNFRSAGLLRALFPEAPIVHARRSPVETGFSIYRHDFSKAWSYATNLTHIAHYYGEYVRMMDHWDKALELEPSLFQHETFVASFDVEARRLIGHCGLDWRDECLSFHVNKRPVATFSAAQVRQPLQKKTSSAHERYGDVLKPLIDGLSRAGVDLETGALIGGGTEV